MSSESKPGPEKEYDGKRVTLRLNWELRSHLEDLSDKMNCSLSGAIRHVLKASLEANGRNPEANPDQVDLEDLVE